jgi:hypothetical protein
MSEVHFRFLASSRVTPLTVGRKLQNKHRKNAHRRNDIVLHNDQSISFIEYPQLPQYCDVESADRSEEEKLTPRTQPESSPSSKSHVEHRDELHSNLYSSVLEAVRTALVASIPQVTDEMISRAIINAFADSNLDRCSHDSSESDCKYHDNCQYEVNRMCMAYNFMNGRHNQMWKKYKVKQFLQTVLDETFLQIRREELTSSEEALCSMKSVLCILRVKVNDSVAFPMDAVLIHGLPITTNRSDLVTHLSRFGEIKSVAIATGGDGFGYCCFFEENSVLQTLSNQSTIEIHGVKPTLSTLHRSDTSKQPT